MKHPKISVLMGIYNCEDTLEQAVGAILKQTYTDWELILCDDGSTDNTYQTASALAERERRIILLKNKQNLGLNKTLNKCLAAASGAYIARMDGDDDCLPERFQMQADFLDAHPEFDLVSSPMTLFDEHGVWGETSAPEYPTPEQVATGSPICHAPVMLRKSCIDAVGGYTEDPRVLRVEDVDLWIKLYAHGSRCYNIQKPLYCMRNDTSAFRRRKYRYRINAVCVRLRGCKTLHLPLRCYLLSCTTLINGLVPARLRQFIRKRQSHT